MRPHCAIVMTLLACASASRAGPAPRESDLLFGHRIQLLCIAQDPAFEQSVFGRSLAAGAGFQGWSVLEQEPFSQCLRQRRFLDKSLCDEVTTIDVYADVDARLTTAAMAAALHRHEAALVAADDVISLQEDALYAHPRFSCPATLPHPRKTSR